MITYIHDQNEFLTQISPKPTKTDHTAGPHVIWHCQMSPEGSSMCPAV